MAIDAGEPVINFGLKLSDTVTSGVLYTPKSRTIEATVDNVLTPYEINYGGKLVLIKLNGYIDSIPITHLPVDNIGESSVERERKQLQLEASAKYGVRFSLNIDGTKFSLANIEIYNVRPIYDTLVSVWLGDVTAYGVSFGNSLDCDIIDFGYGLLQPGDWIDITGWGVENSSFLQDTSGRITPIY